MAHLGSKATSTTEKGGRKSSRWEGRSRDADVGIGLPGGGREGSGWEIDAACVGRVLRAACVGRGHLLVCGCIFISLFLFSFVFENFSLSLFFQEQNKKYAGHKHRHIIVTLSTLKSCLVAENFAK